MLKGMLGFVRRGGVLVWSKISIYLTMSDETRLVQM